MELSSERRRKYNIINICKWDNAKGEVDKCIFPINISNSFACIKCAIRERSKSIPSPTQCSHWTMEHCFSCKPRSSPWSLFPTYQKIPNTLQADNAGFLRLALRSWSRKFSTLCLSQLWPSSIWQPKKHFNRRGQGWRCWKYCWTRRNRIQSWVNSSPLNLTHSFLRRKLTRTVRIVVINYSKIYYLRSIISKSALRNGLLRHIH